MVCLLCLLVVCVVLICCVVIVETCFDCLVLGSLCSLVCWLCVRDVHSCCLSIVFGLGCFLMLLFLFCWLCVVLF